MADHLESLAHRDSHQDLDDGRGGPHHSQKRSHEVGDRSDVGLARRTYSRSKEREAYGVAGAAFMPYNGIEEMLGYGKGAADIVAQYQVSEALVQMRLKVTGAVRNIAG